MVQRYAGLIAALGSAGSVAVVTPDDDEDLATPALALWVGGAGDVELIAEDDTVAVVVLAVPAGTLLPIRVARVLAANTTATPILALS